jgi:hypothetical protein
MLGTIRISVSSSTGVAPPSKMGVYVADKGSHIGAQAARPVARVPEKMACDFRAAIRQGGERVVERRAGTMISCRPSVLPYRAVGIRILAWCCCLYRVPGGFR